MRRASPAINKRRRTTHQWILFLAERLNVTPKTKEHNLIVRSGKSEAEVTNNKRLHSMYCNVEGNYWQTRSIARPLCHSRASYCRLKAYNNLYWLFGPKHKFFRQNAGDLDQIWYTWTGQEVTTFRKFWAWSAHFGQNGSWNESRETRVFLFDKPRDLSGTSQHPIFTKFDHKT